MQQALAPRHEFPILARKNYLASHSLGAMPAQTPEQLRRYTELWADQGILAWDGEWWDSLRDFGAAVGRLLDVPTVVPCLNVTLGFAAIASCFEYRGRRNRIVLSDLEFTTTLPFWSGQQAYGAELVVVKSPDGISLPTELLEAAIDERTCLVISSHAYFRSGSLQDIQHLQRHCRQAGALLVVDAYQSAGCVPFSAADLDFLVGGCHKWLCGGPGGGFLHVRPGLLERLQPRLAGWFGLAEPFAYEKTATPRLHAGLNRFLNGTPNVLGLFAARAGLQWVERVGLDAIREHSLQMTDWLRERLLQRGLRVKTPPQRNGMLCVDWPEARACQSALQELGTIVDYRPDCGIRISPHFYNQLSDLELFVEQLDGFLSGRRASSAASAG